MNQPSTTPHADQGQRKLAAIMFTDIVGYSALTGRNETLAMQLLGEHNSLLRPIFARFGGVEIKVIGDAFMIEFPSVVNAVKCAVEVQRSLHARNEVSTAEQIVIRIGIHSGDVIFRDGDVFGDGVNVAARIEPLAEPGGICVSEDVARQVRNKIDEPVVESGTAKLKNIEFPMQVYRVVLPWLKAPSAAPLTSHSKAVWTGTADKTRTPARKKAASERATTTGAAPPAQPAASGGRQPWRAGIVFGAVAGLVLIGSGVAWFWPSSATNTTAVAEPVVPIAAAPPAAPAASDSVPTTPPAPIEEPSPDAPPAPREEPSPDARPAATEATAPRRPAPRVNPPRASPPAPAAAVVRIASDPPGASVWVDGRPLGASGSTELAPGVSYRLRLELDGYDSIDTLLALESLSSSERAQSELTVPLTRRAPAQPVAPAVADAAERPPVDSTPAAAVARPPDPPVAVPPPPAPPAEDPAAVATASIRKTLGAYEAAYGSLDAAGVQRLWPSTNLERLQQNFLVVRREGWSQTLALDCQQPTIEQDRASVLCNQTVSVSNGAKSESMVQVDLEAADGSWVITALTPR